MLKNSKIQISLKGFFYLYTIFIIGEKLLLPYDLNYFFNLIFLNNGSYKTY